MNDPRRPDDVRLSTADLAAAGDRAAQRGAADANPPREANPPRTDQPAPPQARPATDRDVTRDAQQARQAQRADAAHAPPANRAAAESELSPLFAGNETDQFRQRWVEIQTAFVDEPRQAVERADALVATAIKRLAEIFAQERGALEQQWARGADVNTEDLRVALRRYRAFFDRLLSV